MGRQLLPSPRMLPACLPACLLAAPAFALIHVSPLPTVPTSPAAPPQATKWVAAIDEGSTTWGDWNSGVTVRHLGRAGEGVRISICRYGGPEDLNSCCYGRDNDCNGLGGKEDPACAPMMGQCKDYRCVSGLR